MTGLSTDPASILPLDGHSVRSYTDAARAMRADRAVWQVPENIPLFTMMTVARASGVSTNTLRAWFQRGHVVLSEGDTKAYTKGAPNKFTLRSVLMIAVTGELVRLGEVPSDAFASAEQWMTFGTVEGEQGAPTRREAGGLFAAPYLTYLIVGPTKFERGAPSASLRIAGVDPQAADAHNQLFRELFVGGRPSAKIVLLNVIDRTVRYVCEQAILGPGAPAEPDWDKLVEGMLQDGVADDA